MSFPTSITENIRAETEKLIEMVSGEGSQCQTAHEIESQLWQELLSMGQQLMQVFFTTWEQQEEPQKVYEVEGTPYRYAGQKERKYVSLFGEVAVWRASYWRKGMGESLSIG